MSGTNRVRIPSGTFSRVLPLYGACIPCSLPDLLFPGVGMNVARVPGCTPCDFAYTVNDNDN
jgi:hypothetical protein